ncbi:hypothetical protein FIV42_00685 [Persicimonas caeni]|uniref:Uncharacterized protein n=1 Tax=Persicimonas caeni TaxID=2292766 RepID=A0A4Y6PM23_PERCE|nr:hypothetical protein [Persicimonas caeni]QDG49300.1 hypothetical protein FIV42_00685 [Persicimonas caeni]QED30521.1 hypothetical protein FRD00_00680 [Persicimonas caeni]
MPIPIADSIIQLTDRIEAVVKAELPAPLDAKDTPEYPLPVPDEHNYIVGDETISEAFRQLGGPELYCSIVYEPSELEARGSGDGTAETYNQLTRVAVSIVLKQPAGFNLPTRNGRKLLMKDWMRHRTELYRGAVTDVLTEHVTDFDVIQKTELVRSAVSPPINQDNETYREAAVLIECTQHVAVKIPH